MSVLSIREYSRDNRQEGSIKFFLVLFLALVCTAGRSQAPSLEVQIKAVFLFNFTQFVEWPVKAFPESDSPLVIGILGEDPFKDYIDKIVQGEKTDGHPLVVRRFEKVEDVTTCHILFINIREQKQLKYIFEKLKVMSVLTVGDAPNFTKEGGMIRFFTAHDKMRIGINLEVAKKASLTISSKLLRLANIVSPQTDLTP